ncbi:AraC family transcriptional regulator [Nitratireductor sp. ZSWI3]|uniref:helix-turn-helix domain-containing protein n=1 Tax=Nitratireductor sp. ZSWI3 TaxID=2966359 RepID=UPI00214F7382|nr:AraC family transcriptional regulator [Nitratireductor sp. ZSWI3]MCR4268997.1 AraC family transcriptional regulator [Nitratireductor sp. ZSWI3]
MLPETPQVATFSSDEIPEHQRDEFIRDFYGRIQMRLQIKPSDDHALSFAARTLIFPGMMLTKGSVSPMNWHRTPDLMADSNDDIVLSWNRGGYRLTMPGQGDFDTRPGTAAMLPMDRGFSITSADSRWTMALQFKRSLLAPLVKNLDDVRADAIGRANPAHNLLFSYLWSLLHIDAAATLEPLATRHITDLLAVSLGSVEQHAQPPGVRAARLDAIKQHIARNLNDPNLSAEQVSRRFSISARYIRQLFAEQGTSFSDHVTAQRLAYVYGCLTDRRQFLRRIADIAFEAGFTEPSTFYRQFRLRYGITPTEARLLGRQGDTEV